MKEFTEDHCIHCGKLNNIDFVFKLSAVDLELLAEASQYLGYTREQLVLVAVRMLFLDSAYTRIDL